MEPTTVRRGRMDARLDQHLRRKLAQTGFGFERAHKPPDTLAGFDDANRLQPFENITHQGAPDAKLGDAMTRLDGDHPAQVRFWRSIP
jgi:hypothetical protein